MRIDTNGNRIIDEVQLTDTGDYTWSSSYPPYLDANGRLHMFINDQGVSGGEKHCYYLAVDRNGSIITPLTKVCDVETAPWSSHFSIASCGDGILYLTYEHPSVENGHTVRTAVIDNTGTIIDSFDLKSFGNRHSSDGALLPLGNGQFHFIYTDDTNYEFYDHSIYYSLLEIGSSNPESAGIPASITVPSIDSDGSYIVSWGTSSTSGVAYVLEEATNSNFSSGLRTAYSGSSTSTTIEGRSSGTTYYYRVKATKTGYTDSPWRTGSNGCVVAITSEEWVFNVPGEYANNSSFRNTGAFCENGRLYLPGSYHYLYCLDQADGSILWQYPGHFVDCMVVGDFVYATKVQDSVYCLRKDTGEFVWKSSDIGALYFAYTAGNLIVSSINNVLYCLDSADGSILWETPLTDHVVYPPAVSNGYVYFVTNDGYCHCAPIATGQLTWSFNLSTTSPCAPAVSNGYVYVGGQDLYCLNAETGASKWKAIGSHCYYSAPAIKDNRIFAGSNLGYMKCYDTETGAVVWSYSTGDWMIGSPCIGNESLYVPCRNKKLYQFDLETGGVISQRSFDSLPWSEPVLTGNRILIGVDGDEFYSISSSDSGEWPYYKYNPARTACLGNQESAGIPSSITVPPSDSDGSYTVSWGASSTSGVTYVLEEATNSSFTSGLRTAYSGSSTSTPITGRSSGTSYYYRVKATKTGYTDSSWRTGSNGCLVTIILSIGDAVENTSLTWTTAGDADWYGQSAVSYYGGDAAQSGNIGDSESTWVQTTVSGPVSLSFYWKVSSESGYDYLRFYIDGTEKARICGKTDWQQEAHSLLSGSHTIKWAYTKDGSYSDGSDAGWLDKVSVTTESSNACQLVMEGRNHLFNNGDPTYSGIVVANSKFGEAVNLGSGSSCSVEANFFYALTRMLSFVLENGSSQSIETGRDLLEAFGLTRNEIVSLSEGSPYNVPNQFPSNSPSGATTQAFLTGPFMDLIDQSLANLNVVPKTFTTVLTATETGSDAIEVDDGDVQTFRTILHCMKSVLFLLKAYDLDMDIDDIKIRIDRGYFDINRDLLNKYAGFLMLLQNGDSALAASKASLIATIDSYSTASISIRSETDDQSDDLIRIQPQDAVEEADFRSQLAEIKASLKNHSLVVFENTEVNAGEFFDDPMNLRNFLPPLSYDNSTGDLIKEGPFPDSTFSGVLPNLSSCPDCSGDGFTLKDFTFYSNTKCECANNKWVRIGPNVFIQKDASVTIDAPTVIFEKQVHAEKGAYLHIK